MSIFENIEAGKYVTGKDRPAWEGEDAFRADLIEELGLTGHPKADILYAKAWEMGHSAGFSDVANVAFDLVDLIRADACLARPPHRLSERDPHPRPRRGLGTSRAPRPLQSSLRRSPNCSSQGLGCRCWATTAATDA